MTDQERKTPKRSSAAKRFDEITLVAFTAVMLVTIAAVLTIGIPIAEDRLGCGLNDIVNRLLAYPRQCR